MRQRTKMCSRSLHNNGEVWVSWISGLAPIRSGIEVSVSTENRGISFLVDPAPEDCVRSEGGACRTHPPVRRWSDPRERGAVGPRPRGPASRCITVNRQRRRSRGLVMRGGRVQQMKQLTPGAAAPGRRGTVSLLQLRFQRRRARASPGPGSPFAVRARGSRCGRDDRGNTTR